MTDEGRKKRQLGRGLSALLGDEGEDYADLDRIRLSKMVPTEFVEPGPFQPRRHFDEEDGLADSIREKGILQPILVRRHPNKPTAYEIIAGERRWRAAQKAKLHEIPVIIKDLSDGEVLEVSLVENLQRQDLNPLEEAQGYSRLIDQFSHTQENLAKFLGKSRSHIANMLRLLTLPDSIKEMIDQEMLSAGHARALLGAGNAEKLAKTVVLKGLNVRQTEKLAQSAKGKVSRGEKQKEEKDANTLALEKEMSNLLGLAVTINYHEEKGGRIIIWYQTLDQLEEVLARLSHRPEHGETAFLAGVSREREMGVTGDVAREDETAREDMADGPLASDANAADTGMTTASDDDEASGVAEADPAEAETAAEEGQKDTAEAKPHAASEHVQGITPAGAAGGGPGEDAAAKIALGEKGASEAQTPAQETFAAAVEEASGEGEESSDEPTEVTAVEKPQFEEEMSREPPSGEDLEEEETEGEAGSKEPSF